MTTLRVGHATTIDYETRGAGTPLVLVHGSWDDRAVWSAVTDQLDGAFRTVAYSRRGHGESSGGGSLDDDVADLAALTEAVGPPAVVAGNSLGAIIALRLASARPELVAAVCAHEPPLLALVADDPQLGPLVAEVGDRIGGVLALIAAGEHAAAAERFLDEVALGPGTWAAMAPAERQALTRHAATFGEENSDPGIYVLDEETLAGIRAPVLLTGGGDSSPMFAAILSRLEELLPRAQRVEIPGAAHIPHVTHPEEYSRVIRAFAESAAAPV